VKSAEEGTLVLSLPSASHRESASRKGQCRRKDQEKKKKVLEEGDCSKNKYAKDPADE